MARKKRDGASRDLRCFVQVADSPSMGVEVSTGRPWVGVDQQVGHGSADALFAMTDEQYAAALVSGWAGPFEGECWSGKHDDLRLFDPRSGSWRPERWIPRRTRMLAPRVAGEIWWHLDALGEPAEGERVGTSRSLAADTAVITVGADGIDGMTFSLVGDAAYPRPAALIAGLVPGGDREQVRAILGDPVDPTADEYSLEGVRVRLGFVDGGLTEVAVERPDALPPPGGPLGTFLAALGQPEEGPAFRAAARLAGAANQRWAASSGIRRRLIAFATGVAMQVEDDRVLSVRVPLASTPDGANLLDPSSLFPGLAWPATRADLHDVLGAPVASSGGTDLHRYGRSDLLVDYGPSPEREAPIAMTAVMGGVSVAHGFHRWRSGDFTRFLDVLGRGSSNALVALVREASGVRVRMSSGVVAAVEVDPEAFPTFLDGLTWAATRKDITFGYADHSEEHDSLWYFEQGWVHAHAPAGDRITRITVRTDFPGLPDATSVSSASSREG